MGCRIFKTLCANCHEDIRSKVDWNLDMFWYHLASRSIRCPRHLNTRATPEYTKIVKHRFKVRLREGGKLLMQCKDCDARDYWPDLDIGRSA